MLFVLTFKLSYRLFIADFKCPFTHNLQHRYRQLVHQAHPSRHKRTLFVPSSRPCYYCNSSRQKIQVDEAGLEEVSVTKGPQQSSNSLRFLKRSTRHHMRTKTQMKTGRPYGLERQTSPYGTWVNANTKISQWKFLTGQWEKASSISIYPWRQEEDGEPDASVYGIWTNWKDWKFSCIDHE